MPEIEPQDERREECDDFGPIESWCDALPKHPTRVDWYEIGNDGDDDIGPIRVMHAE